ncbi:MAG: cytochrome c oxidase subunit II [Chloroflexi bacterium]|nr:cytochrome c oxidase subunit II [Chloroflexota bacterium]
MKVVRSGRFVSRIASVALLFPVLFLLSACFPSHDQSTFGPAGPIARDQLTLFQIIFWTAAFVFVVVEGALVLAVVRFRRKPGQVGLPKQTHGNTPLELTWTILPAIILAVIAVPTVTTIFAQAETPKGDVVQVEVVGHQWWWEFNYPQLGITTANELHIPVNKPVALEITSDDVIHSFWVPKLAGKTDMIPTRVNTMWFEADEAGVFFGQCAEFCGTAHAQMRFKVVAQTQGDFDQWVAGQQSPAAAPMSLVFGIKGCTVCHTVTGQDPEGTQEARMAAFREQAAARREGPGRYPAPNLTHFASRAMLAAGLVERTDENLRRWLEDPDAIKPGNRMKQLAGAYHTSGLALSSEDITELVSYLQSLK